MIPQSIQSTDVLSSYGPDPGLKVLGFLAILQRVEIHCSLRNRQLQLECYDRVEPSLYSN
jgi:hypothetical protein